MRPDGVGYLSQKIPVRRCFSLFVEPTDYAVWVFIGPAVVVGVVQEARQAVLFFVLAVLARKIAHHCFHSKGVYPQPLRGSPFLYQFPGAIS
jgi:hypothetical protein